MILRGPKSASWLCSLEFGKIYVVVTKNDGLILDPKKNRSLEVYADYDYSGNWNNQTAPK